MKKFVKIAAVILVAVVALTALVACGPSSDPDTALASLKSHGYSNAVKLTSGDDFDAVVTALSAASGDLVAVVTGSKGNDTVTIWYFKNSSTADKYMDKAEDIIEQQQGSHSNWQSGLSNGMIYFGTFAGISAAR